MELFKILILSLALICAVESIKCPKKIKSSKVRPTLPKLFWATYEIANQENQVIVIDELHDEDGGRFALIQYTLGIHAGVYKTVGSDSQYFSVTGEKGCQETDLKTLEQEFVFKDLRINSELKKDSSVFLDFIVDLPDKYLIGYVQETKPAAGSGELPSDQWQFCIDGTIIDIFWTLPSQNTHSKKPYPNRIKIEEPTGEIIYLNIFKFLANEISEEMIEPPLNYFCHGRHNNKILDTSKFITDEMSFNVEFFDTVNKRLMMEKHLHSKKLNTAVITKHEPDLESPHGEGKEVDYIFAYDLDYFFRLDRKSWNDCEAKPIETYEAEIGDIFALKSNTFADSESILGKKLSYFYAGERYRRGIHTEVYSQFRRGYPVSMKDVDSTINWFMAPKDTAGQLTPVGLDFQTTPSNQNTGELKKLSYNLFNWHNQPDTYSRNSHLNILPCSNGTKEVTFEVKTPKNTAGYINLDDLYLNARDTLSLIANIHPIRLSNFHFRHTNTKFDKMEMRLMGNLFNVPKSNLTISEAATKIKDSIDSGKLILKAHTNSKKLIELVAVKNSMKIE